MFYLHVFIITCIFIFEIISMNMFHIFEFLLEMIDAKLKKSARNHIQNPDLDWTFLKRLKPTFPDTTNSIEGKGTRSRPGGRVAVRNQKSYRGNAKRKTQSRCCLVRGLSSIHHYIKILSPCRLSRPLSATTQRRDA